MHRLPSISSLISPPEAKPLDSFDGTETVNESLVQPQRLSTYLEKPKPKPKAVKILPSPPESPLRKPKHHVSHYEEYRSKHLQSDPILYPNGSGSNPFAPLFADPIEDIEQARVVDEHIRKRNVNPRSNDDPQSENTEKPTREDYLLVTGFVSKVCTTYNQDPGAYLKRAREEVDENFHLSKRLRVGSGDKTSSPLKSRKDFRALQPLTNKAKSAPRKHAPSSRQTSGHVAKPSVNRASAAPRRVVSKKHEGNNTNYQDVPDFSPPVSTLPNNPRALNVEWQGSLLDHKDDPLRHLLHEAELHLASRLRLSGESYLLAKRRIFVGRVNNYIRGKKFTKTDAQSCGHIDVNKSSKIWTAYEKVGWFDRGHFDDAIKYVQSSIQCYDPVQDIFVQTSNFF